MGTIENGYSVGDWVVHSHYGVGQIKAREKKSLTGVLEKKEDCFRVRTRDGIFWFSATQANNSRIRPIVSKHKLRREINNLKKPPQYADQDRDVLNHQISEVRSDMSLATTVFIVRELFAIRARKNLGMNDEKMLTNYSTQLADEYAIVFETDEQSARSQLNEFMRDSDPDVYGQKPQRT